MGSIQSSNVECRKGHAAPWIQIGELEFVKHNGTRRYFVWAETPGDPASGWAWAAQIHESGDAYGIYASGRSASKRASQYAAQKA